MKISNQKLFTISYLLIILGLLITLINTFIPMSRTAILLMSIGNILLLLSGVGVLASVKTRK